MAAIPTYTPRKRRKKAKLTDLVKFTTAPPPKKTEKPTRPTAQMRDEDRVSPGVELKRGVAKGLATASAALPGRGTAGRILKAGLAGAAGGAELEASYQRYKERRAKSKAKKATTTVTQSAMAQKAKFHKKEHSKTEKR